MMLAKATEDTMCLDGALDECGDSDDSRGRKITVKNNRRQRMFGRF